MMPITESTENVLKTTISKTALTLKSPPKAAGNTVSMSATRRQEPGRVARDFGIRCLAPPPK